MKNMFRKLVLILILAVIVGIILFLCNNFKISMFMCILYGYFTCVILNYEKFYSNILTK